MLGDLSHTFLHEEKHKRRNGGWRVKGEDGRGGGKKRREGEEGRWGAGRVKRRKTGGVTPASNLSLL